MQIYGWLFVMHGIVRKCKSSLIYKYMHCVFVFRFDWVLTPAMTDASCSDIGWVPELWAIAPTVYCEWSKQLGSNFLNSRLIYFERCVSTVWHQCWVCLQVQQSTNLSTQTRNACKKWNVEGSKTQVFFLNWPEKFGVNILSSPSFIYLFCIKKMADHKTHAHILENRADDKQRKQRQN